MKEPHCRLNIGKKLQLAPRMMRIVHQNEVMMTRPDANRFKNTKNVVCRDINSRKYKFDSTARCAIHRRLQLMQSQFSLSALRPSN